MEKDIKSDAPNKSNSEDNNLNELTNPKDKSCKRLPKPYLYFIYFLIFSFIGWLLETVFSFYNHGYFVKRGFLFGPICPIYGFGALILILFFRKYKKHNFKLFLYAGIICSIFEYIVSFVMEALFSLKWWDYSRSFLNLNGRISLFYSFAWGIIAVLFINFIFPFFKKKVNIILSKTSYKVQVTFVYLFFILFIADTVLSCIKYILLF